MRLEWILLPGFLYGVVGLGLGFCLYLFLSLKCEIRALEKRGRAAETTVAEAIAAARAALDVVRAELRELQEQTGMLVPPAPAKSGLNLSKRGQVLQMFRRGQAPEQIAASLGLPLTEIELLIKVHQIVLEQVS
jgi:plasmid stabilization system protein ParE